MDSTATLTAATALPKSGMDRFHSHAGNTSYDSDADADDEFERPTDGVASSPAEIRYDDDDDDDEPSESSDERDRIDGEDTPTTQGWAERDGRTPTGKITQWSEEQVADYIMTLSPPLKPYGQAFIDGGVSGDALIYLHHDELRELGVNSVGLRLTILKAVYEQKVRCGCRIEESDYVPLSAEGDMTEGIATQDDIARVIESIKLRDQRIIATEVELRAMKQDLDRVVEENKKLREEALPIMRMMKDQSTPLPDPSGGSLPSPREPEASKTHDAAGLRESKSGALGRKLSNRRLFLAKQSSPTYPPLHQQQQVAREVRDDTGAHLLEASAAATAASNHLTASMSSTSTGMTQASTAAGQTQRLSPTSPAYNAQPPFSAASSYHHPSSAAQRAFPRDVGSSHHGNATADDSHPGHASTSNHYGGGSSTSASEGRRRAAPTPSPRDDEGGSTRAER